MLSLNLTGVRAVSVLSFVILPLPAIPKGSKGGRAGHVPSACTFLVPCIVLPLFLCRKFLMSMCAFWCTRSFNKLNAESAPHLQARDFESQSKFKDAEKAYIQAEEYDLAIQMYRKVRSFDPMIKLVQMYRKESLTTVHVMVAQTLESDGNYKEAEHHFVEAKDWKSAVQMYRNQAMWDDALRVAKVFGGVAASRQVRERGRQPESGCAVDVRSLCLIYLSGELNQRTPFSMK